MKSKKALLSVSAAALYVLLIVLLTAVESASPEANIKSLPLALWYSLTTLTTVGYGDLYPVTAAGRVIGAVFQLMSLGILALLIGAFATLFRSRFLPLIKLRLARKREWFVFPELTKAAMPFSSALASALLAEDAKRVIVLCGEGSAFDESEGVPFISSPKGPKALANFKKDGRMTVFCMDESSAENERLSKELEDANCEVCCMTSHEPDKMPARRRCFDPFDCCARLYWRRFPLLSPDEEIVMIGDGKYAEAILACGLELNVTDDKSRVRYRVFGDYDNFRRDHHRLSEMLSVNAIDPERDSILLSDEPWNARPELLKSATRLVFCSDCESLTIERLTELFRFFPVSCPVHAKLSLPFDGVSVFGSTEELFTPELVIRSGLNGTAIRLNEIYRRSAGGSWPDWNGLSAFTRRSNVASAEHLRVKIRILLGNDAVLEGPLTPELCKKAYEVYENASPEQRERFRRIEHERWMRFHLMNNWSYAEKRDNAARQHPLLVPFNELSEADRIKDDYGWELLNSL